jgi:hypothetical protein
MESLCATDAFDSNYLYAMQIDAAHDALAAAYPLQSRKLKGPDDAEDLKQQCLAFDRLMAFDAKHALQNASIVGECARFTTGM